MAAVNYLTMDALHLITLDTHLSRWCSSSSQSASSSDSRSASSTGYTDCPTMSKSLTESSDTQTENDTPPESPSEDVDGNPAQNTPVIRDAHLPIIYGSALSHIA